MVRGFNPLKQLYFTFTDDGTVALISGTPPVSNESGGGHFDYDNVENTYRDLRH